MKWWMGKPKKVHCRVFVGSAFVVVVVLVLVLVGCLLFVGCCFCLCFVVCCLFCCCCRCCCCCCCCYGGCCGGGGGDGGGGPFARSVVGASWGEVGPACGYVGTLGQVGAGLVLELEGYLGQGGLRKLQAGADRGGPVLSFWGF